MTNKGDGGRGPGQLRTRPPRESARYLQTLVGFALSQAEGPGRGHRDALSSVYVAAGGSLATDGFGGVTLVAEPVKL